MLPMQFIKRSILVPMQFMKKVYFTTYAIYGS